MKGQPLHHIIVRHAISLLKDITHRPSLQMQTTHKSVNTPHPAKELFILIKHETEQLPQSVVSATTEEDTVSPVINKRENLVIEIVSRNAISSKQARIDRRRPRQRKESH